DSVSPTGKARLRPYLGLLLRPRLTRRSVAQTAPKQHSAFCRYRSVFD
ncbi:SAM-dependent methyltransferase domain protein, partial [Vibrio cholerae HC-68A1]